MEPITISAGILGALLWENFGQPLLDKAKDKYADKVFDSTEKLLTKLPFSKAESEVIEAEIIESINNNEIGDKETFISFLETNENFVKALKNLKETKKDVEILNSFKDFKKSEIKIIGNSKLIENSFNNVSDSKIEL